MNYLNVKQGPTCTVKKVDTNDRGLPIMGWRYVVSIDGSDFVDYDMIQDAVTQIRNTKD